MGYNAHTAILILKWSVVDLVETGFLGNLGLWQHPEVWDIIGNLALRLLPCRSIKLSKHIQIDLSVICVQLWQQGKCFLHYLVLLQ
ncbi:hypothetical protein GUJ93_ZPchr0009g1439 [Zizania palustris]|uniref:Uncharacterized protein n=1 Tax=Zizania palustris TaxID=103762 RepID=A0A8J5RH98_ZIZPA|nr:hypothetical protein GUJ93_ZPchr0009g1439 [Zizania palustris]